MVTWAEMGTEPVARHTIEAADLRATLAEMRDAMAGATQRLTALRVTDLPWHAAPPPANGRAGIALPVMTDARVAQALGAAGWLLDTTEAAQAAWQADRSLDAHSAETRAAVLRELAAVARETLVQASYAGIRSMPLAR